MTKEQAKRIVYDNINYWRRTLGRFARKAYDKEDIRTHNDYCHDLRLVMYIRDGIINNITSA